MFKTTISQFLFKLLLGLLMLSFAVWGIGDVFRSGTSKGKVVLEIGERKIYQNQIDALVNRQLDNFKAKFGQDFDTSIVEPQLRQAITTNMTQELLLEAEIAAQNLQVSRDVIADKIQSNPALQTDGVFDADKFNAYLQNNRFTEKAYINNLTYRTTERFINDSILSDVSSHESYAKQIYQYDNEKRKASYAKFPINYNVDIASPTDDELTALYEQNKTDYIIPEKRKITVLEISEQKLKKQVILPDNAVQDYYNNNLDEFLVAPEKRVIKQIKLADAKQAEDIYLQILHGQSFADATAALNLTDEDTNFGEYTKTDIYNAFAQPVFAAKQGEVLAPINVDDSYYVLYVAEIIAPSYKPFSQASVEISDYLKADKAGAQIQALINKITNQLKQNTNVKDIAAANGLQTTDYVISKQTKYLVPDAVINQSFTMSTGQVSDIIEANQAIYVTELNEIQPAIQQTYEQVKDAVKGKWQQAKRDTAINELLAKLAAQIDAGELTISQIAKKYGVDKVSSGLLTQAEGATKADIKLNDSMFRDIFSDKKAYGPYKVQEGDKNSYYLIGALEFTIPAPEPDALTLVTTKDNLDKEIKQDLYIQFLRQLQDKFVVN